MSALLMELFGTFGIILFLAVVFYMAPDLSRPDLLFAVTVGPEFPKGAHGLAIRRAYRRRVWMHAAIGAVLAGIGLRTESAPLSLGGLLWPMVGACAAFAGARRATLPYAVSPTTIREAAVVPRPRPPQLGLLVQLGPFVILAAAAAFLARHFDEIPARFPIHWDLGGRPNGWSERTVHGVFLPLLVAALVCGGLIVLGRLIVARARRVHATGPGAEREERLRRLTGAILTGSAFVIALSSSWAALSPFVGPEQGPGMSAVVALTPLLLLGIVGFALVRMVRGRAADQPAAGGPPIGDRTPDECWKWGLIYVNRHDPAWLIEKRWGIGYTLNFGSPWAWLTIALFVLAPVLLLVLLR